MKKLNFFSLFLLVLLMTNCNHDSSNPDNPDNPENTANTPLCEISDIEFTSVNDAELIIVNTKLDWNVTASDDWIKLTENKGKGKTGILVGVEDNVSIPRNGKITITTVDSIHEIKISQFGPNSLTYSVGGVEVKLILAPAGQFLMGLNNNWIDGPQRRIKIDSLYICETEVTNELWKAVTGTLPYDTVNAIADITVSKVNLEPVTYISWNDVQKFLTSLNLRTGSQFRLPTEAEWQYAASGANLSKGYIYSGSNNLREVAWYQENSGSAKQPVKQLLPNELMLYDMSGNVSEWCNDWYKDYYGDDSAPTNNVVYNPTGPLTGTNRVVRGGNYASSLLLNSSPCNLNARSSICPVCYEVVFPGTVHEKIVYGCGYVGFRFVLPLIK